MAINTYATLKDAIQRWAKRNDILGTIDDFIDLAEADMWKGPAVEGGEPLRIRDMEALATDSASTASRFLALPSSYLEMRRVRFYSGSASYEIGYSAPESMSVLPSAGIPTSYTITSQIEFNRIPNSAFTFEFEYFQQLTALSASNTTNAILTRFPDVYLFGCLYHFGLWAIDDMMATKYGLLFATAIKQANKTDKKGRYSAAKSMKREGPTP